MGKPEETLEKTQDKINLDEIMLEFTKDYNLDSLKYPEIKKNMLRAFGTLKNIMADNNDEIEMTRDDWDRFHSNISKHVLSLKDKITEIVVATFPCCCHNMWLTTCCHIYKCYC